MRRAPKPLLGARFLLSAGGSSDTERVQGGRGRQGINCQLHVAPVERLFSTMRKVFGVLFSVPIGTRGRPCSTSPADVNIGCGI